jgi:hypothetical protein
MVHDLDAKGNTTGKVKNLNLFPEAKVHPAGTSQSCSKCHRNPIQMVYKILDKEAKHVFKANTEGQYELSKNEFIYLYTRPKLSTNDIKKLRRQKINRLPSDKLTDLLKGDEMVSAMRRCLRHRQESTRSKDTSQSRYRCLFADCGHAMHADENAAINIGYKWFTEKLVH